MWCAKCQADVSTDVAANGQSINCTTCGSEVRKTQAPSLHPEIRRARQLIEELSSNDAGVDSPESETTPENPEAVSQQTEESPAKPQAAKQTLTSRPVRDRNFRVDIAHPTEHGSHSPPPNSPARAGAAASGKPQFREDEGHQAVAAPHFDLAAMPQKGKPGKAESIWGQLLAYGGVAVLTVGTALVLWGHFGGPPEYAPTGWLVATAGQMLLFLGVVTLISGGMQQTTHEVTSRVEYIGSRMLRFEQTAEQVLRGPHFGREGQSTTKSTGDNSSASK